MVGAEAAEVTCDIDALRSERAYEDETRDLFEFAGVGRERVYLCDLVEAVGVELLTLQFPKPVPGVARYCANAACIFVQQDVERDVEDAAAARELAVWWGMAGAGIERMAKAILQRVR